MTRSLGKMVTALVPIYGITLIDCFGYMLMVPLLPYLAQRYGASGTVVGALLATMAVASVVAAPVWGALSDRVGRKPVVLVSQAISLAGYVLIALAPTLTLLFVARGVAGIGGGNLGVTQSYIADVTDEAHRERAYAIFGAVFGLGIVLGPLAGGFLVRYGFWAPFGAAALVEAINIALTVRFLPAVRRRGGARLDLRAAARTVWRRASIRRLAFRHFLFIFAVTYFFTIFALDVRRTMGLGPEQASWLLAAAGLVGGISLLAVVAPLSRRIGPAAVAQLGLAVSVLAYAGLAFARNLELFSVDLAAWAFGASCIEPSLSTLLSESAPEDERGATMGFNDALSNVGLMCAPALGGWMVDRDVALVGLIPGAAVLAAFCLGLRGPHARPRRRKGPTAAAVP
jgi:MFS family permease